MLIAALQNWSFRRSTIYLGPLWDIKPRMRHPNDWLERILPPPANHGNLLLWFFLKLEGQPKVSESPKRVIFSLPHGALPHLPFPSFFWPAWAWPRTSFRCLWGCWVLKLSPWSSMSIPFSMPFSIPDLKEFCFVATSDSVALAKCLRQLRVHGFPHAGRCNIPVAPGTLNAKMVLNWKHEWSYHGRHAQSYYHMSVQYDTREAAVA